MATIIAKLMVMICPNSVAYWAFTSRISPISSVSAIDSLLPAVEHDDRPEVHRLLGGRELHRDLELSRLVIGVGDAGDLQLLPLRPDLRRALDDRRIRRGGQLQ